MDNKKLAEYLGERLRWNVPQLEKYLDEFEQPILDYKILSLRGKEFNEVVRCFGMFNPDYFAIYSVERLSDNEVFTIEDETEYGIISEFYVTQNSIDVQFTNLCGATLRSIKHKKQQLIEVKLTQTELKKLYKLLNG